MSKVTGEDFIDFNSMKKVADDTLVAINKITESLKELAKVNKQALGNINVASASAKDIENLNTIINKTEKLKAEKQKLTEQEKETIRIKQQIEREEAKYNASMSEEAKILNNLKQKNADRNKQIKEQAKITNEASDSLNAQKRKLSELTSEYNKMSASLRKDAAPAIKKLRDEIAKQEEAIGNSTRSVGAYEKAWGGVKAMFSSFGIGFGIAALVSGIGESINKVILFEKSLSGLKAITGATRKEMKMLSEQAIDLGASTEYTATEVVKAQTELAKMGFTVTQIVAGMPSLIDLATATGESLSSVSEIASVQMKAFGLQAIDMSHIVDVIAEGMNKSALGITDFGEAAKYVAPVARQAGISFEKMTADLAALADAGIKGSMAGTSLRRIYSEIASSGKDVSSAFKDMYKNGLTVSGAIDEVGRNAQTALGILSLNVDKTTELNKQFENVTGSAKAMANTMRDNLAGDIEKATSAWDGFILSLEKGDGKLAKFIRHNVQFVTWALTSEEQEFRQAGINLAYDAEQMNKSISDALLKKGFIKDSPQYLAAINNSIDATIKNYQKNVDEFNSINKTIENTDAGKRAFIIDKAKAEEQLKQATLLKESQKEYELFLKNEAKLKEASLKSAKEANEAQRLKDEAKALKEKNKLREIENEKIREYVRVQLDAWKLKGWEDADKQKQEEFVERMKKMASAMVDVSNAKDYMDLSFAEKTLVYIEQNKQGIQDLSNSLNQLSSYLEDIQQKNIEMLDEYDSQLSDSESKMKIELEKRNAGLANTYQQEAKNFASIKEKREEAKQDQEAYTNTILVLNKMQQASQLALAIANLYSASTLASGPFGIAAAYISAGVMFAQFVELQNMISKFKDGEIAINGAGTETSDSIPAYLSKNESVINAKGTRGSETTLDLINRNKLKDKDILPALQLYDQIARDEINSIKLIPISANNNSNNKTIEKLISKTNKLLEKNGYEYDSNGRRIVINQTGNGFVKNIYK